MYIGNIAEFAEIDTTHAKSSMPLAPSNIDNGCMSWSWDKIFDTELDVTLKFDKAYYIGAVSFDIKGARSLTLLTDDREIKCALDDIKDKKAAPIAQHSDNLTIRIRGMFEEVSISDISVYGAEFKDEFVAFPFVKKISYGVGNVSIGRFSESDDCDEAFATEILKETISRDNIAPDGTGATVKFNKVSSPDYANERYTVSVGEDEIIITAASRICLIYGAITLSQIGKNGKFPTCEIDDMPDLSMRGFHMGLPRADRIPFAKNLFRYVLLPLRYNHLIIEFNGAMRFDRHPLISEKWAEAEEKFRKGLQPRIQHSEMGADGTVLEKSDVRDLIDYARELGFEIIPEVQSFGHVQYITNAYPEIAEVKKKEEIQNDLRLADAHPDTFYTHTYCPSKEKSIEIIKDIIDEIVEVSRPERYVHIGHDEIMELGQCPVCSKKSKSEIYANHINTLHAYLKEKGLRAAIWSDMLHSDLYYNKESAAAINLIPKDILFLDFTWYFHPERDIEDDLLSSGHDIMIGNLYSSHFPRFSSRITKKGMIGGQVSTWIRVDECEYADNGKMFDLAYTAEMLWNANGYCDGNRVAYTHFISRAILPTMRNDIHGTPRIPASVTPLGAMGTEQDKIPANLLHTIPDIHTADNAKLEIGGKYDRLVFEQATLTSLPRVVWKPLFEIGKYTINYSDNTSVNISVTYGGSALAWNRRYAEPLPYMYYRHQGYIGTWYADPVYEGYTADGTPILLLAFEVNNPMPDKEIISVEYHKCENQPCEVIVRYVSGVKF